MAGVADNRAEWIARLLSTKAADRPRAQSALHDLYVAAELPPPAHFFWFDSPFIAAWAVALLMQPHDFLWQRIIEDALRRKAEREHIERIRTALCQSAAQQDWPALVAAAGAPLSPTLMRPPGAGGAPPKSLQMPLTTARMRLYGDAARAFGRFDESDPLFRAELNFRKVLGGQAGWSTVNPLMGSSFYTSYSFSMMAADASEAGERAAPPLLAAAWTMAASAGVWWPFSGAVVISDRPAEIHVNENSLLHRGGGPAALFRDGTRAWAWNGRAMTEQWILHPEELSSRDLKQFDPAFREYAAARIKAQGPRPRPKPSAILKVELPADGTQRINLLRGHNGGMLPMYDRYLAGAHESVWNELIALGPAAREGSMAADALAVAYEIMRRVEANVREVTARLQALGYRFASRHPHQPPGRSAHKQVARLEKMTGGIPLSLRAFYAMVGAVDWTGQHPRLASPDDSIAPDPLVVFSLDDALVQCRETFEDGEGAIMIAPDDLHKANTSGGDPYEIAAPNLAADGKVLNERHDLHFVDYLRLAFRFGGFPGYEGVDRALPAELERLHTNLLPF